MAESEFKQRKFSPSHYPIVIRQTGPTIHVVNYDFGIDITEYPAFGDIEIPVQIARMIQSLRNRIADRLHHLNQNLKNHPTPISTQEILAPKIKDELSVQKVALLLGEAPHTIRRMADDGELTASRTRKGHRRFSRKEIEALLLQRHAKLPL